MAITDELREWKGNINARMTPETVLALRSELNCIADRIEDAAHEEAKRIAKMAFDGGIEYERTCMQYNCDAKAYNWEGWLKRHAELFRPKPTVQSVLREFADGLGVPVADSYIAAAAAKLRLAGEGE